MSLERTDQSDLAQLFTVIAESGLPLDLSIERKELGGFTVYDYGQGQVVACLEPKLSDHLLAALASSTTEPQCLILRQDAFATAQEGHDYLELCAVLLPHAHVRLVTP